MAAVGRRPGLRRGLLKRQLFQHFRNQVGMKPAADLNADQEHYLDVLSDLVAACEDQHTKPLGRIVPR
jgi:hypothetical protein